MGKQAARLWVPACALSGGPSTADRCVEDAGNYRSSTALVREEWVWHPRNAGSALLVSTLVE
jgi:hypothetical protein